MRIAIGSDHRGFQLKQKVIQILESRGLEVTDAGTHSSDTVDYPAFASSVAKRVGSGEVERGVLICGTGIGMAIAANKILGVRAAPCHDEITAEISRRHNDLNVLCLSADLMGDRQVEPLINTWLDTPFEGGRHARRVAQINRLESGGEPAC